jgi:hypothetical protein
MRIGAALDSGSPCLFYFGFFSGMPWWRGEVEAIVEAG